MSTPPPASKGISMQVTVKGLQIQLDIPNEGDIRDHVQDALETINCNHNHIYIAGIYNIVDSDIEIG